ncbi:MAG: flagellar hook-length control protein FliK [Lachnospiraceae bacterium]|nr:flagellar hook-length control protein FliK [Lachnospiraceae bacterium]
MKLTDVFNSGQLKNSNTQAAKNQAVNAQSASVGKQIQALAPGQTLQGEVVARDGNQVQIKVADDFILAAKVDANINLEVGKTMTFEVRNNGQTLQLSPLFANTATQANALKALEMASLPVTRDTVAMTGLMMKAGLPIDKNALQQMFREVNTFSNSNISDVVDLHRLGLAVNEENLAQVSSYKNLTHQLVDGMHTVQNCLGETVGSMVAEGNVEGAARMFQEVLQLVEGIVSGDAEGEQYANVQQGARTEAAGNSTLATGITQVFSDGTVAEAVENGNEQAVESAPINAQAQPEVHSKSAEELLREALTNAVKNVNSSNDEAVMNLTNGLSAGAVNASQTGQMSLQDTLAALLRSMNPGDNYDDLLQQLSQAMQEGSVEEQAKSLQALLSRGLQDKNWNLLEKLISHKDSGKILADGLAKMWTITPEDVADSGKVEELYSRLTRQLKDLSHILEQNGQNQSEAFKAVSNMSQNVDFLQQINQAYTYVQLPLRLQNGEAHGDLYVYTNKRNLSAKDGQISALLHLDMEHLGPVDVYVAMQAERVNTRFYVQDDEMLDFLEQHMDILTQRLQKRGYNCDFAMQVRGSDEKVSGLKGLLAQEQAQPIAQYAFDVRA